MNTSAKVDYRVYSANRYVEGFNPSDVVLSFAELFKITETEAAAFIVGEFPIHPHLAKERADHYKKTLAKIGLDVITERITDSPSASVPFYTCPKCNTVQDKSETCISCGVYFSKYNKAYRTDGIYLPDTIDDDDSKLPLIALILSCVLALLGAYLWMFIGTKSGTEYGILACVIGAVIAAGAVIADAQGERTGMACALLTLLSIFGGKYMHFSAQNAEQLVAQSTVKIEQPAERQVDHLKTIESITAIMAKPKFSSNMTASLANGESPADYKKRNQIAKQDTFVPVTAAAKPQVSAFQQIRDSLGILDIVFILISFCIAYFLGRSGAQRT